LHGLALVALALFGIGAGLVWPTTSASPSAQRDRVEHQLVKPGDLSRLNAAFIPRERQIVSSWCSSGAVDRSL